MQTQRLSVKEIKRAAQWMLSGEPIAFPTETVYGLGAPIFHEHTIKKIFDIKGRPADNPLIAHIGDLREAEKIAIHLPKTFFVLAEHFFPGPLTLVVEKHSSVPAVASGGLDTIAIRYPAHLVAQELIREARLPVVAPSANLSGRPSPTVAAHVLEDFDGKIAAVIDGGACSGGIESTVLDLVSFKNPTILRPGQITKEIIEEVLRNKVDLFNKHFAQKAGSPGMKYRHYAPSTPVKWVENLKLLEDYTLTLPKKRLVLSRVAISGAFDWHALNAQTLYAQMRHADKEGYEEVLIYCDEQIRNQLGLMNRIWHIINQGEIYESDCLGAIRGD